MIEESIVAKSPVLFKRVRKFIEPEQVDNKALRAEALISSTVTVNGIRYDADEKSIDRMDRIISVATARVLGAVAGGMTIEDAYSAYFSSYIVPWKTADNAFVEVPISTLVDVQQEALNNISTIWAEFG